MAPGASSTTTEAALAVASASPGELHQWEAHLGQCGAGMDEGVFGPSAAYKPIKIDADGRASGTASVPLMTSATGSEVLRRGNARRGPPGRVSAVSH